MQHDRLTKYETEQSAVPRQSVKSLSRLPRPHGLLRRTLLFIFLIGAILIAVGIWLSIR